MNRKQFSIYLAHTILDRARAGANYSIQTITHCLRVTGDIA